MNTLQTLIEQRAALDAAIEQERTAHRAGAVAQVRELMRVHGITVADLAPRKPAAKVQPKYRDAQGNTWTGRGLQPVWLRDALKAGATLESFRVAS